MFILFNKQGEVIDFDEEFTIFIKKCLGINNINKELWKNIICKEDLSHFFNAIEKSNFNNKRNSFLLYKIKPEKLHHGIYVFHVGYNTKFPINEFIIHSALIYPLCNKYLNIYQKRSDFIPHMLQTIGQNDVAHILVFNEKIIYANEKAIKIFNCEEEEIESISIDWLKNYLTSKNYQKNLLIPVTLKNSNIKFLTIYISEIETDYEPVLNIYFWDSTQKIEAEQNLELFKYIVDHAGNEFYLLQPNGKFVYVNESAAKSLGYDLSTFSKMSVPDIDIIYTPEKFQEHFLSLKKGNSAPFITIHKHKDGHHVYKEIKSVYLKIAEDKEYIFGFGQDITRRIKMEKFWDREHKYSRITLQLSHKTEKNSQQLLTEFLTNSLEITDTIAVCLISDETGKSLVETEKKERHKISYKKQGIEEEIIEIIENYENDYFNNVQTKQIAEPNLEFIKVFGRSVPELTIYCATIPIKDKEIIRDVILFFRTDKDFSDEELEQLHFFCNAVGEVIRRSQTEEHLAMRDRILESASKCASSLLLSKNWEEGIKNVLKILGESVGISRTYVFKNRYLNDGSLVTDQLYEWVNEGITPQIDNPELQGFDYVKEGYERWVQLLSQKEPIFGPIRNFPDKERPILESQDIRSIAIVPIFVSDKWWGILGFDDCLLERNWTPAEINALKIVSEVISASIDRKTAEQKLKEQEKRLHSFEKLSSLGMMASGIAHEINNPLAIISLATQHLKSTVETDNIPNNEKLATFIEKIQRNITRIENIIRSLKLFASEETIMPMQVCNLDEVIKEAIDLLQARLENQKINIEYINGYEGIKIKALPTLLTQVIVNLLNNSVDAVEGIKEPKIIVKVEANEKDAVISVEDNGRGMSEEVQNRLLDPFFTTKGLGKGFGVGLPLSKSIIESHGGTLEFESSEGKTRFNIKIKRL